MLQDSDLTEIEVTEGEESVRISRGSSKKLFMKNVAQQFTSSANPEVVQGQNSVIDDQSNIKSPIVGTFYRKPAPDKPPYVEKGDRVEVGQVVCIVEAMKMMNEIKSEFSGIVEEIYIDDATPVEFDQPLFKIK
ncbi:MAG: acetyl-CoA carboxylase biotin carboxyl carrier protein subunit [Gammaproteobacteria bacterium]|nr:MAG: acetyl-CoA carboxylase biotin carboxyl carrier protein subunit [Gammaproteobacteria bacterium]